MAKRKSSKSLEVHISELASVVEASHTCAACGKPITADATTCPHCGTPVGEAAELNARAEESLMDLEKQLAETAAEPAHETRPPMAARAGVGLESAAEVVAAVEVSRPAPPTSPAAVVAEIAPEPAPEPETEVDEPGPEPEELDGFIAEIEAEVGPGEPEPRAAPRASATTRRTTVRAVHTVASASHSSRWVAPVAAGLVLYVLALFLLALLGRFVVASVMIVGTVLVFSGIRARPAPSAMPEGGRASRVEDYVCPLCGTEIPARATQCPTCGAVFEE